MEKTEHRKIMVTLHIRSVLKRIVGQESLNLTLDEGSDFLSIAKELESIYGSEVAATLNTGQYGFAWICVRNKKQVRSTEVLRDGDNVMMLPPLAGG